MEKEMTNYTVPVQMTLTSVLAMLDLDATLQAKLADRVWDRVYDGMEGLPVSGWELQDFLTEIAEDGEFDGFTPALLANSYSNLAQVWRPDVYIFTKA